MANPYMPLYTGDYLRKTRRLNDREHGAYLLILMALWDEGGSLPYDLEELKQIARVPSKTRNWETTVWPKIAPFFTISEGRISQARVTETLAEVHDKRKSYAERGQKGGRANGKKRKQNNTATQAELKPSSSNQTKGLVSPLQGEIPNLPDTIESSPQAASPPSPLVGGGDAPMTAEIDILPDSARAIRDELIALNRIGKVSSSEIAQFRKAVQGERAGRVILHPSYDPPEAVAAIINRPKLKLVQGDHHEG